MVSDHRPGSSLYQEADFETQSAARPLTDLCTNMTKNPPDFYLPGCHICQRLIQLRTLQQEEKIKTKQNITKQKQKKKKKKPLKNPKKKRRKKKKKNNQPNKQTNTQKLCPLSFKLKDWISIFPMPPTEDFWKFKISSWIG